MKTFILCAVIACAAAAPAVQLTRKDGSSCRLENHGSILSTCDVSYKGNSFASLAKSLDDLKIQTDTKFSGLYKVLHPKSQRPLARALWRWRFFQPAAIVRRWGCLGAETKLAS